MKRRGGIPRISKPSRSEFEAIVLRDQPVIVGDAISHWAAMSWTVDSLRARVGGVRVKSKRSPSNIHPDFWSDEGTRDSTQTLADFMALLLNDDRRERSRHFLSGDEVQFFFCGKVNEELGPIRTDFDIPPYFDAERVAQIGFWISAGGVVSALHYDGSLNHNMNAQITGSKRVKLFSPDDIGALSMFRTSRQEAGNFSSIDIRDEQQCALTDAEYVEGTIESGDLLFVPACWHHSFEHLGDLNINVNFWWRPDRPVFSTTRFRAELIRCAARTIEAEASEAPSPAVSEFLVKLEDVVLAASVDDDSGLPRM